MPRTIIRVPWDAVNRGPALPYDKLPYAGGGGYSCVGMWPPAGTTCLVAVDCSVAMITTLKNTPGNRLLERVTIPGIEDEVPVQPLGVATKEQVQAELAATHVSPEHYGIAGGRVLIAQAQAEEIGP